jgi:hypothetical protein
MASKPAGIPFDTTGSHKCSATASNCRRLWSACYLESTFVAALVVLPVLLLRLGFDDPASLVTSVDPEAPEVRGLLCMAEAIRKVQTVHASTHPRA